MQTWTRGAVIKAIQAHAEKHGRPPKFDEWIVATPATPSSTTVRERFGTFNVALEAAGFIPRPAHRRAYWTQQRIIDALQAAHKANGRAPTQEEWRFAGAATPSSTTVTYQFGSWNNAMEAAGFPRRSRGTRVRWTKDAIAEAFIEHLFAHNRWPTYRDWRPAGYGERPNAHTVVCAFGSWRAAKVYAGWDPAAAEAKRAA